MGNHEVIITKLGMIIGTLFGFISLTQANEISKLVLTWVTIVSFGIVIVINIDKAETQIKKWFKKTKKK